MMATGARRRFLSWGIVACALLVARGAGARADEELFGQNRPHAAPATWRAMESARFRVLFPESAEALAAELDKFYETPLREAWD